VIRRGLAAELEPEAVLDSKTGLVTVSAAGDLTIEITGVSGGREYGGQSIASVPVTPAGIALSVDAALDR
jgi:uncharacterized protein YjdB